MKISKKTFDILKNFSGIRSSIHVEQGNTIRTVSTAKNIMAEAKVDEDFVKPFAIFDLGKFIATTTLFQNPEYQFNDKFVTIKAKNSSVNYYYADEKLVEKANKSIKMPSLTVEFDLKNDQIAEIQKASSVLQLDNLCIRNTDEGNIEIVTFDRKIGLNSSSNVFTMALDDKTDNKFNIFIDIELLKLIPDDYHVEIGGTAVAKFTGKNNPIAYWVALRSESTKS
jgi:hypothetical protein